MPAKTAPKLGLITCCFPAEQNSTCNVLDFSYRLPYPTVVTVNDRQEQVLVEVKLKFRLTRCLGPLAIGNLAYTITLLSGRQ